MANNSNSLPTQAQSQSKVKSRAKKDAMTPQEAGRLGGLKGGKAPHRCRGFQCQKQNQE